MYVQCNTDGRSRNHCRGGKSVRITYSECVSAALIIQHAKRIHHTIICGKSGSTFFTLSRKWYDFRKTVTEGKMCSDFL